MVINQRAINQRVMISRHHSWSLLVRHSLRLFQPEPWVSCWWCISKASRETVSTLGFFGGIHFESWRRHFRTIGLPPFCNFSWIKANSEKNRHFNARRLRGLPGDCGSSDYLVPSECVNVKGKPWQSSKQVVQIKYRVGKLFQLNRQILASPSPILARFQT